MASSSPVSAPTVTEFGKLPSGESVQMIRLSNGVMTAAVLTYGANLVSVQVPSAASPEPREVTLNGTDLASVVDLAGSTYTGAVVGRVANRIAGGAFSLDGVSYQLARNNGPNHLHGGRVGFDKRVWGIVGDPTSTSVSLQLVSPDGEEGYPGELTVTATYSLSRKNELRMGFEAVVAGRPTVLNLCNHAYWNLSGADDGGEGAAGHTLWLACRHFVEADEDLVPTGRVLPADGVMDFSAAGGTLVGPRLLEVSGGSEPGFDHCFCRGAADTGGSAEVAATAMGVGHEATVAILAHPGTGRSMTATFLTDEGDGIVMEVPACDGSDPFHLKVFVEGAHCNAVLAELSHMLSQLRGIADRLPCPHCKMTLDFGNSKPTMRCWHCKRDVCDPRTARTTDDPSLASVVRVVWNDKVHAAVLMPVLGRPLTEQMGGRVGIDRIKFVLRDMRAVMDRVDVFHQEGSAHCNITPKVCLHRPELGFHLRNFSHAIDRQSARGKKDGEVWVSSLDVRATEDSPPEVTSAAAAGAEPAELDAAKVDVFMVGRTAFRLMFPDAPTKSPLKVPDAVKGTADDADLAD